MARWPSLFALALAAACGTPAHPTAAAPPPSSPPPPAALPPPAVTLPPDSVAALEACEAARDPEREGCLAVAFADRVGPGLRLVSIQAAIDGRSVFSQRFDDQRPAPSLALFAGALAAGRHELDVEAAYRSSGYGVFAMSPYLVRMRARHALELVLGDAVRRLVVADDRGSITTPLEKRLALEFLDPAP